MVCTVDCIPHGGILPARPELRTGSLDPLLSSPIGGPAGFTLEDLKAKMSCLQVRGIPVASNIKIMQKYSFLKVYTEPSLIILLYL